MFGGKLDNSLLLNMNYIAICNILLHMLYMYLRLIIGSPLQLNLYIIPYFVPALHHCCISPTIHHPLFSLVTSDPTIIVISHVHPKVTHPMVSLKYIKWSFVTEYTRNFPS